MKPDSQMLLDFKPRDGEALARAADDESKPEANAARDADLEQRRRRLTMELRLHTGQNVALVLHQNRQAMLSAERTRLGYLVRAHRIFAFASSEVSEALARFISRSSDRDAARVIDRYIEAMAPEIAAVARPARIRTRGAFFHLGALFDGLNRRYFDGRVQCQITWGRAAGKQKGSKRRRSIKLGSYHAHEELIRIHPALDQAFVPSYFIEFVIFHEMLHAQLDVGEDAHGRRNVHPPEFLALEAKFPFAPQALAWEQEHIHTLLRFRGDRA